MMSGAHTSPLLPGTAVLIHAGRFANTCGAANHVVRSNEYRARQPGPVANTQYLFPSLTIVDGSCAVYVPCSAPAWTIAMSNIAKPYLKLARINDVECTTIC